MQKIRVFADTNVILESFRTGCWNEISSRFSIETVDKCVEETLTGNSNDSHHIKVSSSDLKKSLADIHYVSKKDLASLVLSYPSCSTLDDGEQHLFAWLFTNNQLSSNISLLSTADKAALAATHRLGWLDSAISLEQMAIKAGVNRTKLNNLRSHYRQKWLSDRKTAIRMDIQI